MGRALTHASFFSGVGGLDLGLERAGWRTVSFSEIDPYANAVLAERWPGVPNLGDITALAGAEPARRTEDERDSDATDGGGWEAGRGLPGRSATATLWSGGFPCQDLSVAGKRAGFAGDRSSLAFAFLDLVERHRPPAVLLENVPGLLSSHRGRDMARLVGELAELRYGWAYRILDARHFGVPQRRRRVFIVALDLERGLTAERAAEVLSVGTRCARHPATGHATGPAASDGLAAGISRALSTSQERIDADTESFIVANSLRASDGHHGYSSPRGDGADNLIGTPPDPGGVRAPDGLAGRVDDRTVVNALAPVGGGPDDNDAQAGHLVFTKSRRAQTSDDDETWVDGDVMPTINAFDVGDTRTTAAIVEASREEAESARPRDATDDLLPLGLDSHRYRCCGNGVVSSVAEWVGLRLAAVFDE